jgi:hypothetical protein
MSKFRIGPVAAALAFLCTSAVASAEAAVQVVYVADRSLGRVMVYPLHRKNPAPMAVISKGIVEAEGIAVAANGDLYVANGNGGNVLVYAPGGAGPIRTLTSNLHHPVNVALDVAGNIYVAEQSPSSIVKFSPLGFAIAVYPLPYPNDPVRGVAIDASGDIFASISGIPDVYPIGWCEAVTELYEISAGTHTVVRKFLQGNEQAFGLAIDGRGHLYASDPCLFNVVVYGLPTLSAGGFWRSSGAFSAPFYLTVANDYLSVPSPGNGRTGYVTVIPLDGMESYQTITSGLEEPVSAVVGTMP